MKTSVDIHSTTNVYSFQADQRVLRQLIVNHLPDVDGVLKEHDIGKDIIICIIKYKIKYPLFKPRPSSSTKPCQQDNLVEKA